MHPFRPSHRLDPRTVWVRVNDTLSLRLDQVVRVEAGVVHWRHGSAALTSHGEAALHEAMGIA